jgi:hypothetical protein
VEDLNWRPPLRFFIAELSAELATNLREIKAALLERALSPRVRLKSLGIIRRFTPTLELRLN